jgi:phosphoribosyl 1,2-cyclic phosphodiesterase
MLFGSHPPIEFNSPQSDKLSTWLHEQLSYCQVSNLAIQRNPKDNHDYRNNPSLLISHCIQEKEDDQTSTTCQNIVIDVGKTFREGALRWFPENGISSLDAIVLTHHHMDAVGGLDDVRGFQRVGFPAATTTRTTSTKEPTKNSSALPVHLQPSQLPSPTRVSIPVFLSQECLDQVSSQFPWLFPKQRQLPPPSSTNANASSSSESRPLVPRDVAALDIHVIDENLQPFQVTEGLTMVPLPVWHGDDLISLGFAFSIPNRSPSTVMSTTIGDVEQPTTNVVYISDVSRMIPETLDYILNKLPQPTHILVVDALLTGDRTHPVHYNLEQAVALVKTIKPRQAYLVGMSCDSFLPHEKMNQVLREKYGNIQLAHDGLVIEL